VRAYSFLVASALVAASLTFAVSGERPKPEPSESQMESSFGEFFSKLETRPVSEIQFAEFKKLSCKPIPTRTGYYHCRFTYSTELPAEQLSILPISATISGAFFADDEGHLRFEMVIG
jgi:hypothetical protein